MAELADLTSRFACPGTLRWIGIRPARHQRMAELERTEILATGLAGDHRARPGKRAVSLLQWEHLAVIAALVGRETVAPSTLRRNLVISGINLLGLRKRRFWIGTVELQGTGLCAPCSRMEAALGPGGYTAMRGHGGITAEVLAPGAITLGDRVTPWDADPPSFA
ncbi:MAG: MOSC domain-containing protein [Pseudomonadota bacterium]